MYVFMYVPRDSFDLLKTFSVSLIKLLFVSINWTQNFSYLLLIIKFFITFIYLDIFQNIG